jgi:hypothetical protein
MTPSRTATFFFTAIRIRARNIVIIFLINNVIFVIFYCRHVLDVVVKEIILRCYRYDYNALMNLHTS